MEHLKTDRLILRTLEMSDGLVIEQKVGDYEVAKSILTIPYPYPKGGAERFIEQTKAAVLLGSLLLYGIVHKDKNELIGMIHLKMNGDHLRGELGYWIEKEEWGKGYGTEAAEAVMEYGFNHRGLHRIFAQAFTDNPASTRVMEKIGMTFEGTLRNHVKKGKEFKDLAVYGKVYQ